MRWSPGVLLVLTAACGPHLEPRLATVVPPTPRRAQLRYEIRGRPFPLPLISGRVNGQPVLMLVDTGASSHVVAGWLARRLGLPLKKLGEIGSDHVGKPIATYQVDDARIVLDEWGKLGVGPLLVTEVPDAIERLGIGVFLSPQQLDAESDAVLLDLAKGEVRAVTWDEATNELGEGAELTASVDNHTCEDGAGPLRGLAYVLPATIDGETTRLLVDTGAQHSDLLLGSPVGQRLGRRSVPNKDPMYTASGKVSARLLRGARIEAGEVAVKADVDLLAGSADDACPRDGVLAMDVLRSCRVLLGRTQIRGRCAR